MALSNPWVGYSERSYLTIKQSILDAMQAPVTGIPEMTDFSDNNPHVKRISIFSGIAEQLGYYIDNAARESFLFSQRLFESAVYLAGQYDYRVRGRIASISFVRLTLSAPAPSSFNIPLDTQFKTDDNIIYTVVTPATFAIGDTTKDVPVRQWIKVPASIIATSNGTANQVYSLAADVAEGSWSVTVDGQSYTAVDSFFDSSGTDKHYIVQQNKNGVMEIVFGDGINGIIPPNTKDISVGWYTTLGAAGKVGAGRINTLVSSISLPGGLTMAVTNPEKSAGEKDAEGLLDIRKNVPITLRTVYRTVTPRDYRQLTELAPGVERAGTDFKCGKVVNVYIAPNGGGIAPSQLLIDTFNYLEDKRIITLQNQIFSAGEVIVRHIINVTARPEAFNSQALADVKAALAEFYDIENQLIGGSNYKGDLYEKLEGVGTVAHVDIVLFTAVPYARALSNTYPSLTWTRELIQGSEAAKYRIIFTGTNLYKLIRNNIYLGSFATGVDVTTQDLVMNISGNYTAGNRYEFNSYNYNNSTITLLEPSVAVYDENYNQINVTGGLG